MANESERDEFRARYLVESAAPIEKVAEIIAGEQSSGTFLALAGETDELRRRSRARVTRITPLSAASAPSLRSAYVERRGRPDAYQRGEIEIAFPVGNVGANLAALMSTVAGNLFELGEVTGLRLMDLELPNDYVKRFPGPRFGVAGTRAKAGVRGRPLIGTIIKPSIGLTPGETAELVDSLCAADIDFIKDDELIADPPYAPFAERLAAVMPVLRSHAERLGGVPMYAIDMLWVVDAVRTH